MRKVAWLPKVNKESWVCLQVENCSSPVRILEPTVWQLPPRYAGGVENPNGKRTLGFLHIDLSIGNIKPSGKIGLG